jgi:hypothetical protein
MYSIVQPIETLRYSLWKRCDTCSLLRRYSIVQPTEKLRYSLQRSCGTAFREGVIMQPTKEVQHCSAYREVAVQPIEKV